ncbi:hypothetical protein AM593_03271, partial [Mytilus galloprovincialis]
MQITLSTVYHSVCAAHLQCQGVVLPSGNSIIGRWAPLFEKSKLTSFACLGGCTVLWAVAWFLVARDTPDQNKWISKEELNYIKSNIQFDTSKRNGALSSLPFACQVITGFLLSQLVDFLRKRSLISTTLIRRLCSCL